MSSSYHLRITPRDGQEQTDFDKLKGVLTKYGCAYICVEENEDANLHWHTILFCAEADATKVRKAIQYAYDNAGNAVYSMKKADEAGLRYICKGNSKHPMPKGDPPVVKSKYGFMFTDEFVRKQYDSYWEQSVKVKTSKDLSWTQRIVNELKMAQKEMTQANIVDMVISMYAQHKNSMNPRVLADVVRHIMCNHVAGYRSALAQELNNMIAFQN